MPIMTSIDILQLVTNE